MNRNFTSSLRTAAILVVGLLGLLQVLEAHAFEFDLSGRNYDAPEARRAQRIRIGTVEDIRITETTREHPNGGYAGAALGASVGAASSQLVSSNNQTAKMLVGLIGGTVGSIFGKMAGDSIARERKVTAEIVVTLSNGDAIAIVQEVDQDTAQLQPGDKVRLIEGQNLRVVKYQSQSNPAPATY